MLNIKHVLEHEHCVRGYHIIGKESLKGFKVFGSKTLLKHKYVKVSKWAPELTLEGNVTARGCFTSQIPRYFPSHLQCCCPQISSALGEIQLNPFSWQPSN